MSITTCSRLTRKDILVAAYKVHAAGVMHNDIEYLSRTIALGSPPAPVAPFVGFDKAEAHHCPLVESGVMAEDIKADIQQFGHDCLMWDCPKITHSLELPRLWQYVGLFRSGVEHSVLTTVVRDRFAASVNPEIY